MQVDTMEALMVAAGLVAPAAPLDAEQDRCIAACEGAYEACVRDAQTELGGCILAAGIVISACFLGCLGGALIPGVGLPASAFCVVGRLAMEAGLFAACFAIFAVRIAACRDELNSCLSGCGLVQE